MRGVKRSGVGTVVDVSLQEVGNLIGTSFIDLIMSLFGRPPLEHLPPPRALETPSIEPTLDGHVGFTANSREQFDSLLLLLGRPDLVGDEELATVTGRNSRLDEWLAVVRDLTTRHTTAEIVERASELRVPAVPVGNGATITELEHLRARAVFVTDPTGSFTMPRRPWRIDHEDIPAVRPAPSLGADTAQFEPRPGRNGRPGPDGLPLEGVRVLDMSNWWAAPATAQLLASLGADVIKVESTRRPDGSRFNTVGMDPAALPERWWERSPIYSTVNTNKRGLTLDLTQERGLEVMKRLVARSDVVLENFTPRVLEQLGLTWDVIRDVNPRAILVRMPAFGLDGPWRDNPGFAQTMEQLSGLAWVTGYADGPPMNQGGVSDPVAGAHAAFALLVALAERDVTGVGCHVEVPMVEGALNTAAEQLLEYSAYGTLLTREGNRAPWGAPQNVYACRGHERWLALSVADEAQWLGLQAALGDPAWATDPQLDTHIGRRQRHDHLDAHLAAWAAALELDEAVAVLLDHGVPAGAVADPRTASTHPQLVARGFFEEVEHPVAGTHPLPTVPFRYGGIDRWIRRPAPTLGQHTREILRELCDLDDGDLDDLERMGVIGTMPRGL